MKAAKPNNRLRVGATLDLIPQHVNFLDQKSKLMILDAKKPWGKAAPFREWRVLEMLETELKKTGGGRSGRADFLIFYF